MNNKLGRKAESKHTRRIMLLHLYYTYGWTLLTFTKSRLPFVRKQWGQQHCDKNTLFIIWLCTHTHTFTPHTHMHMVSRESWRQGDCDDRNTKLNQENKRLLDCIIKLELDWKPHVLAERVVRVGRFNVLYLQLPVCTLFLKQKECGNMYQQ